MVFIPYLVIYTMLHDLLDLHDYYKYATTKNYCIHKNIGTNEKFCRKVAFLMYTEIFNFRPQSLKAAPKQKAHWGLGKRLTSSW